MIKNEEFADVCINGGCKHREVSGGGTPIVDSPDTPLDFVATTTGETTVELTWTLNMDSTEGYDVFVDGVFETTVFSSPATIIELSPWTEYEFSLQAFNPSGARSAVVYDTAKTQDNTPPTMPGSISASPISETQVNLSWLNSVDNDQVAGYEIRMGLDEVGMGPILATTTNLYYNATGLTSGQTVYFDVRAYDRAGNFSPSARRGAVLPDLTAPTTPANLTATPSGFDMQLQWDDSFDAGTLIGYTINKNGSPFAFTSVSEFLDITYSGSMNTTYSVIAVDGAGNTSGSAVVTVLSVDRQVNATLLWQSSLAYTSNTAHVGHHMMHAVDQVNGVIIANETSAFNLGVRSIDRGLTWGAIPTSMGPDSTYICNGIQFDPVSGDWICFFRSNGSPSNQRWTGSTDNGSTWVVLNPVSTAVNSYNLGFGMNPINGVLGTLAGNSAFVVYATVLDPFQNWTGTDSFAGSISTGDSGGKFGSGWLSSSHFAGTFGSSLFLAETTNPLDVTPPHKYISGAGVDGRAIAFGHSCGYGLSLSSVGVNSMILRKFTYDLPTSIPNEVVDFSPASLSTTWKANIWFTLDEKFILACRHPNVEDIILLKRMDPNNGVWSATTFLTLPRLHYSVSGDRTGGNLWRICWLGGSEYTFSYISSTNRHTICKFVF